LGERVGGGTHRRLARLFTDAAVEATRERAVVAAPSRLEAVASADCRVARLPFENRP
jgi:hypothetical protein